MRLRALYNPIQPAVRQAGDNVTYREYLPAEALNDIIYCYWELKTSAPLTDTFSYRVVADGCIDIYFDMNDAAEKFVMGFCRKYTEFELASTFHYFGIRFLPAMFPQLFKIDASVLSNRFEFLQNVLPDVSHFINDAILELKDANQIIQKLDQYLLSLSAATSLNNDPRVFEAIALILENGGMIQTDSEISTGLSARQLRRLFQYYIGDTPKTFSQVVRFQNILRAKPSLQSLRKNKLFFDAGYYDQAHFIKEFKTFYGVTPTRAFGRE
ncbi:MAG: AraC family transcriptional regulator [Chitinophagaceae bacterium]|nr:MAG: AraC family transcriptional regulator [Chitinophagaceae bacterium]